MQCFATFIPWQMSHSTSAEDAAEGSQGQEALRPTLEQLQIEICAVKGRAEWLHSRPGIRPFQGLGPSLSLSGGVAPGY